MERANGPRHVSEDLGALEVLSGIGSPCTNRVTRQDRSGIHRDDLGADAGGGRGASGFDFGFAIDPEQLGVAPREPQDESLVVDADQEFWFVIPAVMA